MTTALTATYPTLLDYANREDVKGGIDTIIEVLAASNPILTDASIMEGNLATGHRSTQRTTQPTGTWRKLNYGVAAEKSTTKQVTDTCGILESYSKLDVDVAKLNGNEQAFRKSEDMGFISGMTSTAATAIFYGNEGTDPEQFQGLAPRYASTSAEYSNQMIDGDGSSDDDETSMWFITWSPNTCSLIYPKGSQAGLQVNDLGKQLVTDSNGLEYMAYVTQFQWKLGLCLRDYRYVIRICNIDTNDLVADASSGADLLSKMVDAYYARPTIDLGNMAKTFIYCNKIVAKFLHKQAQSKSNVNLTIDSPAGKPIVSFLDAPIRVCDNILSTEDHIS